MSQHQVPRAAQTNRRANSNNTLNSNKDMRRDNLFIRGISREMCLSIKTKMSFNLFQLNYINMTLWAWKIIVSITYVHIHNWCDFFSSRESLHYFHMKAPQQVTHRYAVNALLNAPRPVLVLIQWCWEAGLRELTHYRIDR